MTQDAELCEALETTGLTVSPGLDTTSQGEYIVYGYVRSGALWGDDGPSLEQRKWFVIYAAPTDLNRLEVREQIRDIIFNIFGAWPSEDQETTMAGQRYIYEFETIGGL